MIFMRSDFEDRLKSASISTHCRYDPDSVPLCSGLIWNRLDLGDGFAIKYVQDFCHPPHKPSQVITQDAPNPWQNDGLDFNVLQQDDPDGDLADMEDVYAYLREHTQITQIDYSVMGDDKVVSVTQEGERNSYTVVRDNERDLRFTGTVIAEASSTPDDARSDYSGSTGRWTELTLYCTTGDKYVCEQIGCSSWQGEHDRHSGAICETIDEVIAFFGTGWLAKQLYEEAGIEAVELVE